MSLAQARVLIFGAALVGLCGCERPSSTTRELPENPDILRPEVLTAPNLLANAEKELDSRRVELLRTTPESLAGLAQADAAIGALRREEDPTSLAATTIVASFGDDYAGQPYVTVIALVPSREMIGVRFVFADRAGNVRRVAVKIERKFKSVDYIESWYFRRVIQDWNQMKRQLPEVLSLTLEDGMKYVEVPWPEQNDQVACAVGVEDRLSGIGNFVKPVPYDAEGSDLLEVETDDSRP